jgi:hypothetical protein
VGIRATGGSLAAGVNPACYHQSIAVYRGRIKTMVRTRFLLVLTLALSGTFHSIELAAQEGTAPLFSSHDVLAVTIEAPITTLMRERPEEEYLDGKFTVDGQTFDLKLRTRGNFRRQKANCPFAPIRLNFQKGQVGDSVLAGQDKLKLVTHCNTRRGNYDQLVLREYLTYRILQALTDKHFGARLMRITYVDTEGEDPIERWGFVIEDEDDIGARLGYEKLEVDTLSYRDLDASQTTLISVYQYLIGNTDFSFVRGPEGSDCCHNSVPFSDGTVTYPIPYDFDHAGLIDAPYAKPAPQFNIRSVKTRVYRGRCPYNDNLPETFEYILSKRGEIEAAVAEVEGLDKGNRREVDKYLEQFFDVISDPKKFDRQLVRKCV